MNAAPMTATMIRADARALPLVDASVDLIITSPPYFALRSYQDGGEHYAGQIGSESTPTAFLAALVECTREMMRVLKPTGSIWVNLGDKYNAYNGGRGQGTIQRNEIRQNAPRGRGLDAKAIPNKSLMGIPWRYALRCVDELGLILRAEVIWAKPNGLPESVTDRVRRSHEQWFHFTRQPRYFSAVDEIRETYAAHRDMGQSPLGKLPGSVWQIPSQPLTVPEHLGVDHFAAFPTEWPRRIILGWSPSGICTECGEGRRPVTIPTGEAGRHPGGGGTYRALRGAGEKDTNLADAALRVRFITGFACACPEPNAPTRPALVLDPFGGTGTTALAAKALGRHGISVDMSADYCRIARWRTNDPGELAKALKVEKPQAQLPGQGDLFELIGGTP